MNIYANDIQIRTERTSEDDAAQKITVTLEIAPESNNTVLLNADYLLQSKQLAVDIDRAYNQRSKDANALFWALCGKLADAVQISNQEMYARLIEEYGVVRIVTVDKEGAADMYEVLCIKYKSVKELGDVIINGVPSVQYQCCVGSHTYNTKQMSRLITGTIDECVNLDIPVDTPRDVKRAVKEWGV